MIGIYQIENTRNGNRYIGSSVGIEKRWKEHKRGLNGAYHSNPYLQRAWNKYGEDAFKFSVLENLEEKSLKCLHATEQWWLYHHKGEYNIADKVQSPMFGKRLAEETRLKMSKVRLGRKFTEKHRANMSKAMTGKKFTESHIANLTGERNGYAKLKDCEVLEIRRLCDTGIVFQRVVGEMFRITQPAVSCIVNRTTWKHI